MWKHFLLLNRPRGHLKAEQQMSHKLYVIKYGRVFFFFFFPPSWNWDVETKHLKNNWQLCVWQTSWEKLRIKEVKCNAVRYQVSQKWNKYANLAEGKLISIYHLTVSSGWYLGLEKLTTKASWGWGLLNLMITCLFTGNATMWTDVFFFAKYLNMGWIAMIVGTEIYAPIYVN